jgi:hypothetical protein
MARCGSPNLPNSADMNFLPFLPASHTLLLAPPGNHKRNFASVLINDRN